MFLTNKISFQYFCTGLPSDHFCQIIFNCDHWFQETIFLSFPKGTFINETGHAPWRAAMFLTDQIRYSYFCRSPRAHFYQTIWNSDHRFQRR